MRGTELTRCSALSIPITRQTSIRQRPIRSWAGLGPAPSSPSETEFPRQLPPATHGEPVGDRPYLQAFCPKRPQRLLRHPGRRPPASLRPGRIEVNHRRGLVGLIGSFTGRRMGASRDSRRTGRRPALLASARPEASAKVATLSRGAGLLPHFAPGVLK